MSVYRQAKKLGMCKEFRPLAKSGDTRSLCLAWFEGAKWCMEHNFPDVRLLAEYPDASRHGLWLNDRSEHKDPFRIAFFGNSDATVIYSDFGVGRVYVIGGKVTIKTGSHSIVFVHCKDVSQIEIKGEGKVFINER